MDYSRQLGFEEQVTDLGDSNAWRQSLDQTTRWLYEHNETTYETAPGHIDEDFLSLNTIDSLLKEDPLLRFRFNYEQISQPLKAFISPKFQKYLEWLKRYKDDPIEDLDKVHYYGDYVPGEERKPEARGPKPISSTATMNSYKRFLNGTATPWDISLMHSNLTNQFLKDLKDFIYILEATDSISFKITGYRV